jgi:hypothetical protein
MAGRKVVLGNGNICRLWKDHFIDTSPLCEQFPVLFDLCQSQDISLKDALDLDLAIPLRRILRGENLNTWNTVKTKLLELNLSTSPDSIHWSLNQNRIFSTKSVYIWLQRNLAGSHNRWIWKAKIHLKIKIFLWQMCQDAILTRENM